jgi:hypothetical protein
MDDETKRRLETVEEILIAFFAGVLSVVFCAVVLAIADWFTR